MALFRAAAEMTDDEIAEATDDHIRAMLGRPALARFPARLAVARVQAANCRSCTSRAIGAGRFRLVVTRDVETEEAHARRAELPMVTGVAPLNRFVLPNRLDSDRDLRTAAAALRANMLLIYTFDTDTNVASTASPIDLVTLGFLPSKRAEAVTTATANLVDTRNRYVYAPAEATATADRRANTWTRANAVDQSRRWTQAEAFGKLVEAFAQSWEGVIAEHGPAAAVGGCRAV